MPNPYRPGSGYGSWYEIEFGDLPMSVWCDFNEGVEDDPDAPFVPDLTHCQNGHQWVTLDDGDAENGPRPDGPIVSCAKCGSDMF